ncbi:hypothetical protein PaSz4_56 [Pseudomonas phage PaSz-4]|nr:hypothetical protein PaSz4_56 [Pseudomonas phage PaSz-4]
MSLILPPQTHAARELIDLGLLASLGEVENRMKLPTLREAKASAARTFAGDRAIRQVNMLVLRADGNLELIGFGPRGGRKTLWKFGQL